MPVANSSAQAHPALRGVPTSTPTPGQVKQADPVRDRPRSTDDRLPTVTLEPHWTATIDAATD